MVDAIIRWCLRNPFLMVLILVALCAGGTFALLHTPVDAIPDIGEKQVIVYADWSGRTRRTSTTRSRIPLTTSLHRHAGREGHPLDVGLRLLDGLRHLQGRRRLLLGALARAGAHQRRPAAAAARASTPVLGPDATALGQVYWYTVEGEGFDLAELRSIQDWYVRYQLNSVEGVSEVASIGGFVKQYQIDVHPDKLRAHRVTLMDVYEAVRKSNIDVGAKVLENNGVEFFIRGVGFVKTVEDLENVVIREEGGTPHPRASNVATVQLGPDFRRGALDKAGVEAVGGVVLMRYGENPRDVVERVKAEDRAARAGLPSKTLADGRVSHVRSCPSTTARTSSRRRSTRSRRR